ncbi:hypothetical protein [Ruminiclostridium papyrosolvens]|uniref:Uncharacterized protein n=1 Tax=Ruminiclostridium papyrosolvens C7 TaxID=1330534 RepID=U4QWQ4_9FIRM|nr:hypothetical protein [Ruminiclostridium papyrosolvens]EPR07736.1 hypothetical protein L323_19635 [Ruminiclostridium papyrosolvens C7]
MFKKILSTFLAISIMVGMSQTIFATNIDAEKADTQVILAKTAYVKDVNENGTNLNNDVIDGNKNVKQDTKLKISINPDNSMNVFTNINGADVTFNGIPAGRSENSNAVFFTGKSSDPKYSIINFSYEKNISESSMYFKSYKEQKNSKPSSLLKIYLKVNGSDTRDYIFFEAFNFKPTFDEQFISNLPKNTMLGAWAATQFKPIESYSGEVKSDISIMSTSNTKNWYCTKSFNNMGENETHTIKWLTNVDYSNVPVGQETYEYYTLKVTDKTCRYSVNTNLNSDSESCLHVDALSLDQTSIPYTAWKSTKIDGLVQKSAFAGDLSASISVTYGLLSLSYSIPVSFSDVGSVDIDGLYNSYLNGVNGDYTRSINTEMDSGFRLTQEGHYFMVRSALRDYGNTTRSAQTLKSRWHINILNAATLDVYPLYFDHDVSVSIT